MDRVRIKEAIVVEGRDDLIEVSKVFDTLIIVTHGFGIREETWQLIDRAYREKGIIVLTDPDFSGEEIRRRITERYPDARQAWIPVAEATRKGDIGVENARPEAIRRAILASRATAAEAPEDPVTMETLRALGLTGSDGAAARRQAVCEKLAVGYSNSKAFVRRLATFGITKQELTEAVKSIEKQ
ncbi:MAG: ribonuclease M5 [Mogibacterium sp.]|nr:ribonuclease M5 [Mogibacterium sp.]